MESVHTNIDEWKAKKQQERDSVIDAQRKALDAVMQSEQSLGEYLVGRGRLGSYISSGNAALILQANPKARGVKNYKQWQDFGRNVSKGAVGIPILVRQNKYFNVDKVFDVSQTYGNRPFPSPFIAKKPEQLANALDALKELCPVDVEFQPDAPQIAAYDRERGAVICRTDVPPQEMFQFLPGAVLHAFTEQHTPGVSDLPLMQIYGAAVSVELCGRFGIPLPEHYEERLNGFREHLEDRTPREMLEELRETARAMGDCVERSLSIQKDAPEPVTEQAR